MRVLVVDDNDAVREAAAAALRGAGFEVTQAAPEAAPGEEGRPLDVRVADPSEATESSSIETAPGAAAGHLHLETAEPVRVLVIENNESLREPITEGLRQAGVVVVEAADAREAMSHCGERFDVLFTDIDLPGGVDGWTIAERWRDRDPDIAVIYTSGFCLDPRRQVSGSRCLAKPYRPGQIVAAVVELANERTARGSGA
jgi:CheY-like chemotaxis protein